MVAKHSGSRVVPSGPTARQGRVLAYIRGYIGEHGFPPSIRDIGAALDIRSPNGVVAHLNALERKGLIRRRDKADGRVGRARSIRLPGVNAGGFSLPLLGRVAAGPPIEGAAEAERLDLRALFGVDGYFAYRVGTDALLSANVAAGDSLVLRPAGPADGGRTVAAESADGSLGLFDYLTGRSGPRLHPRHGAADPAARVIGVLMGVVRKT